MKKILEEDRAGVVECLKRLKFIPYNVIGIIENTKDELMYDQDTGSAWISHGYFNYVTGDKNVIVGQLDTLDDGFYGFSAVEGTLAEAIYSGRFLHWCEPTERHVYGDDTVDFDALLATCPYEIVPVPIEEAQGIDDRYEYQQEGSLDRIKDAILNRPSSAIYLDGTIASYVLVHEDNSIGYMFTLEKYRHMGLGYWVTLDLLRQMKAKGAVSFVEITKKNFKSQGLAAKTGFAKDAYTPWFGIIKGFPEWFKTWDPLGGQSFYFTSLAQMRFKDGLTWSGEPVAFAKIGEGYEAVIGEKSGERNVIATFLPDESNEAYILRLIQYGGYTLDEMLCVIAQHFPEQNASLIIQSDVTLEHLIGGYFIKR